MDVFIPLGGKQNNDYLELRFALRSIERYMTDLDDVFIAGDIPSWVTETHRIDYLNPSSNERVDVHNKILSACLDDAITDDFLLWHDDFFAFKDFDGETLPFYSLDDGVGDFMFQKRFNVHYPVRYNKEMYSKLFTTQDISGISSPRNLYLNLYKAPCERISECIIMAGQPLEAIRTQLADVPFATVNDRAFSHEDFTTFMYERFPDKSRFERD
jgi:hypothetical protein